MEAKSHMKASVAERSKALDSRFRSFHTKYGFPSLERGARSNRAACIIFFFFFSSSFNPPPDFIPMSLIISDLKKKKLFFSSLQASFISPTGFRNDLDLDH